MALKRSTFIKLAKSLFAIGGDFIEDAELIRILDNSKSPGEVTEVLPRPSFRYLETTESQLRALGIVLAGQATENVSPDNFRVLALVSSLNPSDCEPHLDDRVFARGKNWTISKLRPVFGILYDIELRKHRR